MSTAPQYGALFSLYKSNPLQSHSEYLVYYLNKNSLDSKDIIGIGRMAHTLNKIAILCYRGSENEVISKYFISYCSKL